MEANKQERKKYKDIFVVLTYKNTADILDLLESLKKMVTGYRVIVVNSFYDEETKNRFSEIAKEYDCDFIPVENKGYGYGNNKGIAFARQHYEFERIVISNPDIIVERYDAEELSLIKDGIAGGIIINKKGRNQNPQRVFDCRFTNYSPYYLYFRNNKPLFYLSILTAKIHRVKLLFSGKKTKVFSVHGSFLVIPSEVLEKIQVLYDEKIFLFEEEIDIAKLLKSKGFATYYTRSVKVLHKEDGDMNLAKVNDAKLMSESLRYVMDKWG